MKKDGTSRKHHVATSKQNLLLKPYGFCCDVKDNSGFSKHKVSILPFLSRGTTNEGPDIKFRINEDELSSSGLRGGQKGFQKGGRGRNAGRRRSVYTNGLRGGYQNRLRGGNDNQDGTSRGGALGPLNDRLVCERCGGPLRWYLEDEIAIARESMVKRRIEKYNTDMNRNVQTAKRKEKNKYGHKKRRRQQSSEDKEHKQESEDKT
ncbi:uncharacterized protein LOC114883062 [Osmia bicornis bicornis]|uniref:uncharacterized protein LOC114883062 n=1 Tax=Osmia bicornis bicornis TaxID=1437191 RepID=UPI001EAEFBAC|nr:uncharacterized protein LOC114883062 [Osmia bicornis bicornis]